VVEPLSEKHQIDMMGMLRKQAILITEHLKMTGWKDQFVKDVFHSSPRPLMSEKEIQEKYTLKGECYEISAAQKPLHKK
jgi:hypothetical protein